MASPSTWGTWAAANCSSGGALTPAFPGYQQAPFEGLRFGSCKGLSRTSFKTLAQSIGGVRMAMFIPDSWSIVALIFSQTAVKRTPALSRKNDDSCLLP